MDDLQLRPARRDDIPLLGPIEIAADRRYIDAGYEGLPEGDTIPLDVPVDGEVTVRTADRVLMRGRPTTVGGRIAVRTVEAARED